MTPEIVTDLPSRSIRIGVNPVGLLAYGSSDRSCLPSAFAPVACLLLSSPLTVAGPRRILTGFPSNTESRFLYGSLYRSVKDLQPMSRSPRWCIACPAKEHSNIKSSHRPDAFGADSVSGKNACCRKKDSKMSNNDWVWVGQSGLAETSLPRAINHHARQIACQQQETDFRGIRTTAGHVHDGIDRDRQ